MSLNKNTLRVFFTNSQANALRHAQGERIILKTGQYHSRDSDVRETARQLINSDRGYKHIVFYAHGGLNPPKGSAARVRAMKDVFKTNNIYPFHFMYDTGLLEELNDIIFGKSNQTEERVGSIFDRSDRIIERRIGRIGTLVWEEMK